MAKIYIPKIVGKINGNNLVVNPDVQNVSNLFSDINNDYEFQIGNKRQWLKASADFFQKLNVKNHLIINADKIQNFVVKLWDFQYYDYDTHWMKVPTKKLTINTNSYLEVQSMSETASVHDNDYSSIEEMNLTAGNYNARFCNLPKLKKISFNYNGNHPKEWWYDTYKFSKLNSIEEIDLSKLTEFGRNIAFRFNKIPDSCRIKFNPKLLKQMKFLADLKIAKSSVSFQGRKEQTENSEYIWCYQESLDLSNFTSDISTQTEPITLTFGQLKSKLKEFQQTPSVNKAIERNKQRKEDANRRREENYQRLIRGI